MAFFFFFFFNDTATSEIYTRSLHDALPICLAGNPFAYVLPAEQRDPESWTALANVLAAGGVERSEEHTSELQSRLHLVCRLLLEKKKKSVSIGGSSK